ncbi:protein SRG1 [Artemisia annua]|uniref:Protein SRG1 n=1 Tax=Artemisia annua TaxID=35608 RepID=A0A2U1LVL8_ARTAN|nr:protein SRG1 [Artemisia annua]
MSTENHKEEAINLGRSLIAPSVQELAKQSIKHIPPEYPHQHDQDQDQMLLSCDDVSVPVIDLRSLFANTSESYSSEFNKLHTACKEWGFFQVINHGINESLLADFKRDALNFFNLPMEEKKKLWQKEDNNEGFGQLFVVSKEQKLDWCDMFYITILPHDLWKSQLFQKLPLILRQTLEAYCVEMKKLAMAILSQMGKALEMDEDEITGLFHDGYQSMRMNHYPPCPQPNMAMGISPHSDANALTILYQLNTTDGLEVRKDGKWVTIKPLPNALVVNIGDIMEIVSNGEYKSIKHRGIVKAHSERLPAKSLVAKHKVANFKQIPLEEFFKEYFARKLDGKSHLEIMKLEG